MAEDQLPTLNLDTPDSEPPRGGVEQAQQMFMGLPPERRRIVMAVGLVVLIGLGYVIMKQANQAQWQPLVRGLLPEDQQIVVEALTAKQIPYELADGGIVRVPEDKVLDARMELASSTMPSGKVVGFELFDESELGRSSFTEKVNYHRALEGELGRTVRNINVVDRARVHLVMPERRLFEEDEVEPSASVVVNLKQGTSLSRRQVQAIRQLVAGAVERLVPGQVSVVDQSGAMLARPHEEDWLSDESLQYQAQYERNLERRVISLLEPVVGHGKVRAQVAVELDFSRIVETEEKFDPESQVIRSEREKTESSTSEQQVAAGVPGAGSNMPERVAGQQPNAPGGKPSNSDFADHIKNYEIDKSTTRRETPHVRLKRLSVAVVVDSGGPEAALPAGQVASYSRLVAKAVGLDPDRGDAIEVIGMEFSEMANMVAADGMAESPSSVEVLMEDPVIKYGLLGALTLLALATGFAYWRRRRAVALQEAKETAERQRRERMEAELLELKSGNRAADDVQAQVEILRQKAVIQSETDIHRAAAVIREWMEPAVEGGGA